MIARARASVSVAALILLLSASSSLAQWRDSTLTAADGTTFAVTTGIVRVLEIRGGANTNTIDLAVVRVRRTGSTSRTAHVMLAGGPGV